MRSRGRGRDGLRPRRRQTIAAHPGDLGVLAETALADHDFDDEVPVGPHLHAAHLALCVHLAVADPVVVAAVAEVVAVVGGRAVLLLQQLALLLDPRLLRG